MILKRVENLNLVEEEEIRSRMTKKKLSYQIMMEKTKVEAKGKGWPLTSLSLKPKKGVVTFAHKEEEVIVAKGSSI